MAGSFYRDQDGNLKFGIPPADVQNPNAFGGNAPAPMPTAPPQMPPAANPDMGPAPQLPSAPAGYQNSYGIAPAPMLGSNSNRDYASAQMQSTPPVTGTGTTGAGPVGGSYGQQPSQRKYMPSSQGGWGSMSSGNPSGQNEPTAKNAGSGSGFAPPEAKSQDMTQGMPQRYRAPQKAEKPTF